MLWKVLLCVWLHCAILPQPTTALEAGDTVYVDAVHGSDTSGNGGIMSPFLTLIAARNLIRANRTAVDNVTQSAKATVRLRGTVRMSDPFTLEHIDSGTKYTAWDVDGNAGLSGFQRLQGRWMPPPKREATAPEQLQLSAPAGAWSLRLAPEKKSGPFHTFNSLFANGQRLVRAREPELGSFYRMEADLPPPRNGHGFVATGDDVRVLSASTDLNAAEAVVYSSWMTSRRNIETITEYPAYGENNSAMVLLRAPARIEIDPYANSGSRYYLENYREACDEAGEWFLDATGGVLYFQPRHAGEDPNQLVFEAPSGVAGDLLVLNGTSDVTFEDFTIEGTDWSIDPTNSSSGTVQAASFLATAAVHLVNASSCVLDNVTIVRVGTNGVWVDHGCSNTSVLGCYVADTGAGGIRIGRGKPLPEADMVAPVGTRVENSTVVWGSHVYREGNGILLQHSSNNTIARNEVAFFGHCGISVGWTWDYTIPSGAVENIIRGNLVHHVGNGELSDLAGIYFLGVSNGTRCEENVIHSAIPYYEYGHGIYLDQATSHVSVRRNLVYLTEGAGCYQHFGHNNTFTDNIFALGRLGVLWHANFQYGQFGPSDLQYQRNIAYAQGPMFQSPYNGTWISDYNVYFNASDESPSPTYLSATFPNPPEYCRVPATCNVTTSYAAWKAYTGNDAHSLVTAPAFVDAAHFNFQLKPSSPVFRAIEFEEFNHSSAGPSFSDGGRWYQQFLGCPHPGHGKSQEEIACKDPGAVANADRSGDGGGFACGDVIVYRCRPGFRIAGSTFRQCTASGWSGTQPRCLSDPRPST
eukprot:m.1468317 g.1468317  ORF g.1468317 m.1468317 type:complete len:809 (+) comp25139_c0_seq13:1209-3635(+)